MDKYKNIDQLHQIYFPIKDDIEKRIEDFKLIFQKGDDVAVFTELVFCLFTPQSKAKVCWDAVLKLKEKDYVINGSEDEILSLINNVRFKYKKAHFVVLAREKIFSLNSGFKNFILSFDEIYQLREWIVENIKGIGYKEAGHFLRNIGFGSDLAILDRHILKNMVYFGVIDALPKTITKKTYYDLEKKLLDFSNFANIKADHLDIVLWYKQTNEIFK